MELQMEFVFFVCITTDHLWPKRLHRFSEYVRSDQLWMYRGQIGTPNLCLVYVFSLSFSPSMPELRNVAVLYVRNSMHLYTMHILSIDRLSVHRTVHRMDSTYYPGKRSWFLIKLNVYSLDVFFLWYWLFNGPEIQCTYLNIEPYGYGVEYLQHRRILPSVLVSYMEINVVHREKVILREGRA
jgi:hypothetical protein